jgi:acetyltransferase-like isoleucine patch superfamily enzyme
MLSGWFRRYLLYRCKKQGLQIGDDCRIYGFPNFGSEPYLVSIGCHVMITARVSFITHDGGIWVLQDKAPYKDVIKYGRITVRDNCFIGYGATILPGVTIGPSSVVAAGALVTQDVPPNTVVGGVPAKVLMTVEEYAEKCLREKPPYDPAAYVMDKRTELLRLFPRPW